MTTEYALEHARDTAWRTRDIVVAATIGVVFGIVFWAWNILWNTAARLF